MAQHFNVIICRCKWYDILGNICEIFNFSISSRRYQWPHSQKLMLILLFLYYNKKNIRVVYSRRNKWYLIWNNSMSTRWQRRCVCSWGSIIWRWRKFYKHTRRELWSCLEWQWLQPLTYHYIIKYFSTITVFRMVPVTTSLIQT